MISKNTDPNIQFLTGGGVMGKLIREKDWSNNQLGTPNTWPQSLRTTLSIILNSKFPMFLFWGPDLICFYNDAYLPSFGNNGKHPDILGGKAELHWKEIWKDIKPLLDQVLEKGESTWNEDMLLPFYRNGKMEDIYWTFSYSPVHDESGKPAGIFTTCFETTEKVNLIKQLNKSNERYLKNIMQAPLAMCILKGSEFIVEVANDLMLEIWDKNLDDVLNKPIFKGLPEAKEQGLEKLLDEVFTTGEKFVASEHPIQLPRNGKMENTYIDFIYEALLEADGTITGVVASANDVTKQVTDRIKVEESEKKVRSVVENAPFAIAVYTGEEMLIELANESIITIWGKGNDVIGKTFTEVMPELADQLVFEQIKEVYKSGKPFHTENTPLEIIVNGKPQKYYFNYSFTPLYDLTGKIYGVMNTGIDLTDLNLARKKLERSEEKLNIVINASELGTWELNIKTMDATYSDRYLEIIGGYTERTKLSHGQLLEHIHPDDIGIRNKAFQESLKTGYLIYETRVIWKDQSIHWMEGKGKVFYDTDGLPDKMIGTVRDITKERKDQLSLIENERKFRLLSDSMPQQIWTSDTEGNLNYYNKSVFEYSGLSLKDLYEKSWLEIVHPDDKDENIQKWKHSITTGEDFLIEHRFRRYDGEYRWQLSRAIPQRDEDGKIRMWVGSSTDIQDQKTFSDLLEKQVKERTKELNLLNEILKESEERYHLMVGEVQDYAILYLSKEGIIENWNKGAQKIKGYKAEEIVGRSFENFYTAEDRENNLPKFLLNQASKLGRYGQEGWRVRKDGTLFWANVVITAIHNDTDEVIGFSKVTHDLTFKKDADDKLKLNAIELEQKNLELEIMNKELQSFAYISSHDLQEPLRKIQTFSNQIIDKEFDNLSENGKDRFQRMQNAAQRMQTLINDLLAYSRTNMQDVVLTKTDFNLIIRDVVEDLQEEIQEKKATVEIEKVESDVFIVPFQMHQLIFNLMSNSLKFSRADVPPILKIKTEINTGEKLNYPTLDKETKYCHITFCDNGIGFDQQYSDKIFEVFQRLHGKEVYQGTGIGLAIVKKIMDNHKGFITASGEFNKGATFEIYFPVNG